MSLRTSLVLTAALLAASAVTAAPAHALTALYTPVSGSAFQPLDMVSPGHIVHSQGTVTNTLGAPVTVGASLGRSGGGPATFKIIGGNNGQVLSCTVFPRFGSSGGTPLISGSTTGSTTAVGAYTITITLTDVLGLGAVIFYSIECTLPGGSSIQGVNTGNDRFFPVTGSGFVPSDNTVAPPQHEQGIVRNNSGSPVTVEASVGHANIPMTFDIKVNGNGGQIICRVIQKRDTGTVNFPQPSVAGSPFGLATLSVAVPAFGPAFHTISCSLPAFNGQAAQILGVSEVGSAMNLFFPFSGEAFTPVSYTNPGVVLASGKLKNSTTSFVETEVSLGHAQGGANGFLVYGRATGAGLSCTITVRSLITGVSSPPFTNSFFGSGQYTFTVQATPPSGGRYFYTMRCNVGPGTEIDGVRPDA